MSSLGMDTPLGRPDADERAALYVPLNSMKADVLATIRKGAAIVGFANHDGTVSIYFESNRFNDVALLKWEHKARKAYDRLIENSPTTSKMTIDPDYIEQIGYIGGKSLTVRRMASLHRWLTFSEAMDTAPETEVVLRSIIPLVKVDVTKA